MNAPDIKIYKKNSKNIENDEFPIYALSKSLERSNADTYDGALEPRPLPSQLKPRPRPPMTPGKEEIKQVRCKE